MEPTNKIIVKTMEEVMHQSMMPYSEYVIMDRALPRVEDGLKPVQRRVLYSMFDLGITPDKPHKKCARIVGDCLGKYHPHGDTSVYQALVRLAQSFNMGGILVDGHGNFGSVDGDGAAAMRYTEARLAPLALQLLKDLEKETVKWSNNFDDSCQEPDFLPGRFPNLLVNGASGIAVGLATNIPPHNLSETIDAVIAYINNHNVSLKEVMKILKGPDFPTGGIIIGSELEKAYETGKGKILIRAKTHIENAENDKKQIVIDELPFQVNKSTLLKDILERREQKKDKLSAIADITDESDRNGIRAVIKIKKDADPKEILEILYKCTNLQTSYGINMVAIADGKPQQMGLMDIIAYYVDYQRTIIVRRTRFELDDAKERVHILEGLVTAVRNIDEVVKIIKASKNTSEAKEGLRQRFSLSEKQAQAIIDLRLGRLTSLEIYKLEKELEELLALIDQLSAILASKKMQFEVIKNELTAIKKQFKAPRRSQIVLSAEECVVISDDDEEEIENYIVTLNALGDLKKMPPKSFNLATKDFTESSSKAEFCHKIVQIDSAMRLYCFTNLGNCFKLDAKEIPDAKWRDKSSPINKIIPALAQNEKIIHIMPIGEALPNDDILFYTKEGMVKRSPFSEYAVVKSAFLAVKLKDGDEVIGVEPFKKDHSLFFVTKNGICLNADMSDIPPQGRVSGGVKGIKLGEDDYCLAAGQTDQKGYVALITSTGNAKKTPLASIDVIGRYSKGVRLIDLKGASTLVFAALITDEVKLVIETDGELMQSFTSSAFSVESRTHAGKPLFRKNCKVTEVFVYGDKAE